MKYLIDTNICIYVMNQQPIEVIQKFKHVAVENIRFQLEQQGKTIYDKRRTYHLLDEKYST